MTKLDTFLSTLTTRIEGRTIQETIGDSTDNHRVPTVRQVIRYLTRREASKTQREVGITLRTLWELVRTDFYQDRSNNRTDSVDINEFTADVERVVEDSGLTKTVNAVL